MKALGTGIRGVGWREIEILPMRGGKPIVHLHERAQQRAQDLGIEELAVSLSHSKEFAVAFVVGEAERVLPPYSSPFPPPQSPS